MRLSVAPQSGEYRSGLDACCRWYRAGCPMRTRMSGNVGAEVLTIGS